MRMEYSDPMEVSAQVNAWAWLIGSMNTDSGPTEELCHGMYCIGSMIAQNVDAMIADYNNRLGIDSLEKEAPEVSA